VEWRHKNLITLEGWTREELGFFLDQTEYMEELLNRPIKNVPALRGKIVMNCFFENSTRTRASFEIAGKVLSADVINWSSSGSSASKGETLRDTVRTLEAMAADAVVVRHGEVGVPDYLAKKLTKASVFNAGDGTNGHPTQALLDLYTARQKLGTLEGAKMAIIGDVLHSRVARSDIQAFKKMGAHVTLSGPATLMPENTASLGVEYVSDAREAARGADILYFLRMQRERQEDGLIPSIDEYHRRWGATDSLVSLASPRAVVMHPGPMNRGMEIASSVADGPRSVILDQVRSGVAVRMALLYLCLGGVR
jgi:aspartate carbamoyltransferase catalytic subunit